MPYFIAVYDINVKRGPKMLKLFRQYLTWVQNSVFEGEMTSAQFQELQAAAGQIMKEGEDSIIFYRLRDERYSERTVLGEDPGERGRFL